MTAPAVALASGPIAPAAPRPAPQGAADPFAFGAVLELASQRASESRRPCDRGTTGSLERIGAGRVFARTDGSPFAAQRQRTLGGFAVCLAGRLDDRRKPASREQFAFVDLACDERSEIRGQRRIPRRRREGGDRWATGRRTRLSLWPLHLHGRNREPHARGQRAIRIGRCSCRQPYVTSRSQRAKAPLPPTFRRPRPCGRRPRQRLFQQSPTRRLRRRSPRELALHQIARTSHEQPRTSPQRQRKPNVSAPPPVARVATSTAAARQRNRAARPSTGARPIQPRSPRR